jgi:hypothetical protein
MRYESEYSVDSLWLIAVHYEGLGIYRHIASVKVARYDGSNMVGTVILQRQQVADAIKWKRAIYTTAYLSNGAWYKGAVVEVFPYNGTDYLRTDSNRIAADNLGNLPEF